ncbi:MAG TPA: cupin domain-containing protein [Candidatus Acidoferrum sp.]|jgi:quercetin dioxygenase-like cupin family protein
MTKTTKSVFYFLFLSVIASALGSARSPKNSPAQNPSSQSAQTSAANLMPGAKVDPSGVMFFSNDLVSQSFAKGVPIYNGNSERNYHVQIYHRDKTGEVEIHTKDTDIFYVLEGSATFATGGTMLAGKNTAPDELRGPSMNGGEARLISKGDVVIIPANVAHWFKEIQSPITYFVVKVR